MEWTAVTGKLMMGRVGGVADSHQVRWSVTRPPSELLVSSGSVKSNPGRLPGAERNGAGLRFSRGVNDRFPNHDAGHTFSPGDTSSGSDDAIYWCTDTGGATRVDVRCVAPMRAF